MNKRKMKVTMLILPIILLLLANLMIFDMARAESANCQKEFDSIKEGLNSITNNQNCMNTATSKDAQASCAQIVNQTIGTTKDKIAQYGYDGCDASNFQTFKNNLLNDAKNFNTKITADRNSGTSAIFNGVSTVNIGSIESLTMEKPKDTPSTSSSASGSVNPAKTPGATSGSTASDTGSPTYFGNNLPEYVKNFYNWLVTIGGSLAVIMIIWAGYEYATSAGDVEKVNQAKEKIAGAVIGLILLVTAGLVMNALKTNGGGSGGLPAENPFLDSTPSSSGSTSTPSPAGTFLPVPESAPGQA